MNYMNRSIIIAVIITTISFGCQKKDYFTDTGKHTPNFQGNVYEYLQAKPQMFDSLVKVIRIAGMENVFKNEKITFFAPADSSITLIMRALNLYLDSRGQRRVTSLTQIKPEVWRRQLSRYLFKGARSMNDYPQLDPGNLSAYPGQIYSSYQGDIMNIGVIYNDAGGVKYAGYRQLIISFIPSVSAPRDYNSWYPAIVASVNVAPTNGYVHVLNYQYHFFGFGIIQFIEDVIDKGIVY
ncbi:hypothetical protein ESA94_06015 [Lacibacter luteus]|uniref:FAS1 domain-containing protein n=1 Tax=Lacibacter luteus TaxID=2508719 RepID=A0A4Q1CN91_9BACT|nr:hypothetical protein [Lacibacter luteus]RXK62553.1 hypothetical protein ESA94_06015 [Lacibacter luteus]